jgi:uncharacterized protein YjbI with pentapeptide repeats
MGDVIRDEYGVDRVELEKLVSTRLLRTESRLDKQFLELSHDTLIGPIRAHRRRRLRAAWLAGTAIVALLAASWPILHITMAWYERERILNAGTDESRLGLVKALLKNGWSDFSGFDLRNLDLGRLLKASDTKSTDWSHADLRHAKLSSIMQVSSRWVGANLGQADLFQAFAPDSDFTDARMPDAVCSGAVLRDSKLVRVDARGADLSLSDLSRADLSNAHLERATLAGAELRGAKMYGTVIDAKTDFRRTAWWLAEGWPLGSRQFLLAQSSPETFTSTHAYKHGLEPLNEAVNRPNSKREHSVALNNRAWYRAIRGSDLEAALRDAQEALVLAPLEPHILDTRGYIYLRQGRNDEALADCAASVKLLGGLGVGESIYHLGLARESVGDAPSAEKAFADARQSGYRPTYELLFTPRVHLQLSAGGAFLATGSPLRSQRASPSSGSPSTGRLPSP